MIVVGHAESARAAARGQVGVHMVGRTQAINPLTPIQDSCLESLLHALPSSWDWC
jgi:hypothetical protein